MSSRFKMATIMFVHDRGLCDRSVKSISSEVTVAIGNELSLTCLYDVEPTTNRVGWFRNNLEISDNERIMVNDQRYVLTTSQDDSCGSMNLTIVDVRNNDEGAYACRGAGRENGTISVRVEESESRLTKPECSMNITLTDVVNPNDYIAFTCRTDRNGVSVASLDWTGLERLQIKNEDRYTSTLVLNVSTAISSDLTCALTCIDNNESCQSSSQDLSCTIPLLRLSSDYQTIQEGDNVTFTCEVNLKDYRAVWFRADAIQITDDQIQVDYSDDNRSSSYSIFNLRAHQSGSLICVIYPPGSSSWILSKFARLEVIPAQNTSLKTDDTLGRSVVATSAKPDTIPSASGSTSDHRTASVYIRGINPTPSSTPKQSLPLSLNYIIIIAVCGASVVIFFVIIISCGVYRLRRRDKELANDVNPVMAFGDMSYDAPVNLNVHFNVYHQMFDDSITSSDILRLDSSRRIPSVIDRDRKGYDKGHDNRVSSFIPISEEVLGSTSRRRNDDDDIPGRKLSFFVEDEVYVSYEHDQDDEQSTV